jgi:pimeloyl-ACP methyl ester carboxylesterase
MERQIRGVRISYAEHGRGTPLVALHGAGVDHREIEAALEAILPRSDHRRVYPDLPGMGNTTGDGLTSNNDVVALLSSFLDDLGDEPLLLLGHSYGAYLARGLAAARGDKIRGLALFCPFLDGPRDVPEHAAIRQDADVYDELDLDDRAGFDEYFVLRTREMARRYRDHVAPGTRVNDDAVLDRIFAGWTVDVPPTPFAGPTLIVAGRRDSVVGYTGLSPSSTMPATHCSTSSQHSSPRSLPTG